MKKLFVLFVVAMSAFIVSSCSSGPDTKSITPTSTEFTSGELAKYIEVVDQPTELSLVEAGGNYYLRLKVTLKMTKDGFKDVDAHDIGISRLLSVAIINLVDENGTEVKELEIKSEDILKLKKLLTGNEGDTDEIIFEAAFYGDGATKSFKNSAQFTPYLTGDIEVDEGNESLTSSSNDDDDSFSSSSGSEDWDAVLDDYEKYVDKYIALLKKANQGDMSALSEYAGMMEKAQELGEKMDDAQGEMSSAQWSRYTRILQKMTNAAQSM